MQKHTKIYLEFFGFDETDFIACEICGKKGSEIHHIEPKSKFGSKRKDEQDLISNIMCVCRTCHNEYGQISDLKETLKLVHLKYMDVYGKK